MPLWPQWLSQTCWQPSAPWPQTWASRGRKPRLEDNSSRLYMFQSYWITNLWGGCGKGKRPGIGSLYKISWCISFFSRYIHFINSSFNLCKDVFMNSFVYLLPRSGRSPGEGSGYPLQYSCLVNPIDRGAWQATVHVVAESDMTEWLTCLIVF